MGYLGCPGQVEGGGDDVANWRYSLGRFMHSLGVGCSHGSAGWVGCSNEAHDWRYHIL